MFQIFMITYLLMYRKYKQHENVKDFSYLNSVQTKNLNYYLWTSAGHVRAFNLNKYCT